MPTLPLLLAAREDEVVRPRSPAARFTARSCGSATTALERSREVALDYARKARECLRDEPNLEALTHIVIDRDR